MAGGWTIGYGRRPTFRQQGRKHGRLSRHRQHADADADRNSGRRRWLRFFLSLSLLLWLRTNRQQNNSPRRDARDFPAVKVPPASPGVEVNSARRIQTILI
jgi:hypothetical protein